MNYERGELIGKGGMAYVYRGRRIVSGEPVALKYLKDEYCVDQFVTEKFFQEGWICHKLDHPNILYVYDVGYDGERPYIVMEFLHGQTLRARIKQGPLPEDEAIAIACQILEALDCAHHEGIVHRDIKPGNIMLCRGAPFAPGSVKVMDFGIAKLVNNPRVRELTAVGMQLGAPEYMSPEQVRGEGVGTLSDLYSLGIVLYQMLTGEPPFRGMMVQVMEQHLDTEPPPLPDSVSPALRKIVARALAKNPAERFPSARAMLDALNRIATATQASADERPSSQCGDWDGPAKPGGKDNGGCALPPWGCLVGISGLLLLLLLIIASINGSSFVSRTPSAPLSASVASTTAEIP